MRVAVVVGLLVCSLASGESLRSGIWRGRDVVYRVIGGQPVAQGDILLDNVDAEGSDSKGRREAVGRNSTRFLWPGGVIPYVIDGDLPNQERITGAIEHWNSNTPIRLVPRTNETDYVRFRKHADVCSSNVGRVGREQPINLADSCPEGAVIHEIGHAVGLFHEQSRTDRDFHLQLLDRNVDKRESGNFLQALTTGTDFGGYDYASIMHYSPMAFSRNGRPVLQTIPAGIPIGQIERLSAADIDAVRRLYDVPSDSTVLTTFPFGLEIEVDGQRVPTPHTVRWEPGSVHSVSVPESQISGTFRYVFGRWSDGASREHVIVASPDTTVYTASFIRQYKMPLTVSPASAGRLEITPPPDSDGWFNEGAEIEIRPVPASGWNFAQWSGFGAFGLHGISPDPLSTVVRSPFEYRANFTRSPVTMVTSQPPGLQVDVDGQAVTTPRGFVWTAGSTHTVNVPTTVQTVGNATARHIFEGWSDDGSVSHSVTAAAESQTFVARFRSQYIVAAGAVSGGRVELTPEGQDGYYDAGSVVTLRPAPAGGGVFLNWSGDLTGSDDPASFVVDDQKLYSATFGLPREISAGGIVNGANFLATGVSPGQLVTIFGAAIGPDEPMGTQLAGGRVATSLGGYRVLFDGVAAPLLYVTKNQIAAVAPYSLSTRSETVVRVAGPGWTSVGRLTPVVPAAPAFFAADSSGRGPAAALNQDGSFNSASNPAQRGSVVVLYATGEGQVTPAAADGAVVTGTNLSRPTQPVEVRIAGRLAQVLYAGAAPGLVAGVMQVNVEIPADTAPGLLPVTIKVASATSPGTVSLFVGQ